MNRSGHATSVTVIAHGFNLSPDEDFENANRHQGITFWLSRGRLLDSYRGLTANGTFAQAAPPLPS